MRKSAILAGLVLLLVSCAPDIHDPAEISARFRQEHRYETLSRLLAHLRLGMTRAEVEKLLGPPDYSPIDGQYYYHTSDRQTAEGVPIGLVVDYRRTNVRTGEEIATGLLESFWIGPIGE